MESFRKGRAYITYSNVRFHKGKVTNIVRTYITQSNGKIFGERFESFVTSLRFIGLHVHYLILNRRNCLYKIKLIVYYFYKWV